MAQLCVSRKVNTYFEYTLKFCENTENIGHIW